REPRGVIVALIKRSERCVSLVVRVSCDRGSEIFEKDRDTGERTLDTGLASGEGIVEAIEGDGVHLRVGAVDHAPGQFHELAGRHLTRPNRLSHRGGIRTHVLRLFHCPTTPRSTTYA